MTNADRDRSIEQMLRRALPSDREPPDGECPDAEVLAALADDTLPAAARRGVESHVADCHECQTLMAVLARSEPVAGASGDATSGAFSWWKSRRALTWLATATAAATAVAIWVAVPGQRAPQPAEPQREQQIAAAAPAAPAAAQPAPLLRDAPQGSADERRADKNSRDGEPASALDRTTATTAEKSKSEPKEDAAQPAAPAQGSLDATSLLKAPSPSPAPAENREARAKDAAPLQERSLDQAAPAAAGSAAAYAIGARTAGGFEVLSANARIRWRVGPGSIVQYSADGGATWTPQQIDGAASLTAGSSPAPEVCWLVGRAGTVLRTTDGGRRWQLHRFPETVDLTAVLGSSALNATVTLADGRRFSTSDGGQTWAPLR